MSTSSDLAGNELDMLIAKRDKLARELEAYDKAIDLLTALSGQSRRTSTSQYRGMKAFDAAVHYMEDQKIDEISLVELTQALLDRGLYLGKETKRNSTMLKIAITQNINQGRKELSLKDGNKVARKVRKGSAA